MAVPLLGEVDVDGEEEEAVLRGGRMATLEVVVCCCW
jgi:hypothetical protein